jgi:hypothetical protein
MKSSDIFEYRYPAIFDNESGVCDGVCDCVPVAIPIQEPRRISMISVTSSMISMSSVVSLRTRIVDYLSIWFEPVRIFICIFNTKMFMLILTIFFWFVISKQFINALLEKTDIIVLVANENPEFKEYLLQNIKSNYDNVSSIALTNQYNRELYNFELLVNRIGPFFYGFSTLLFSLLVYIVAKKQYPDKVDCALLFLEISAFSTEVIFYYVLLNNWTFMGDQMMTQSLLESNV